MYRRRPAARPLAVVLSVLLLPVGVLIAPTPAAAVHGTPPQIVSDDPADFTPFVRDGHVASVAKVGNTMIIGGRFTSVVKGTTEFTRTNLAAFDATTGAVSTTFAPTVNGDVYVILPAADGQSVYVGGDFTTVNGATVRKLVQLRVSDGSRVATFRPPAFNGTVKDIRVVGADMFVAGQFTKLGSIDRPVLATINATTGALNDRALVTFAGVQNGGTTNILQLDLTPANDRLVAIGNFATVNGQDRRQIVLLDVSSPTTTTVAPWQTNFYTSTCSNSFSTYMRDVDFSPDGSYLVAVTTGAYRANQSCDTVARFPTYATTAALPPTWINYTGGDTATAVAATDSAIYVGGHFRWMNNPAAGDRPGPGAVPRQSLAALDPVNGMPYSWNPTRDRGYGVYDFLKTPDGLWIAHDTDKVGGEWHPRIAFMPLAGGVVIPPGLAGALPNDVYRLGSTATATDTSVLHRVNTGGAAVTTIDAGPSWAADSLTQPSPYRNSGSNAVTRSGSPTLDTTIPVGRVPSAVFGTERLDPVAEPEMQWAFPVAAGTPVQVRLFLSQRDTNQRNVGQRVFDVDLEGATVLDDFDPIAQVGYNIATMRTFDVVSDGTVNIDFRHVAGDPAVNAIEIVRTDVLPGGPDTVTRSYYAQGSAPLGTAVVPSSALFSQARGSFLLDGTLYTGWSDGFFYKRSFDGTTFGPAQRIEQYSNGIRSDMPRITGMWFDSGRLYYSMTGDRNVYYRYFTHESGFVSQTRFTASDPGLALDAGRVRGAFLSGGRLFYADSVDGFLRSVGFANGVVTGPVVVEENTVDWRTRGMFVWNGATQSLPNDAPVPDIDVSCTYLDCTFDSSGSSDPDGSIASRSWSFGDGGTSTASVASHAYAAGGTYDVSLTVTDNRGKTATATTQVPVEEPPNVLPTAVVSGSCVGLVCSVDGSGSSDPDGDVVGYAWSFGDGGSATTATASHTYAAAGDYTVTLTVTDDDGGTATATTTLSPEELSDPIAFRASNVATANATSVSVTVPATVQTGDTVLLFLSSNTSGAPASPPAGWTLLGQQSAGTSSDLRTFVYWRVAAAATGGSTVGVTWPSTSKSTAVVAAWSGASTSAPSVTLAAETVSQAAHTTPTVSVADPSSWAVSYWADKASTTTTSWTAPLTTTVRGNAFTTGGGGVSSLLADSGGAVAATTAGGLTATASGAALKATMVTVVLAPGA